MDVKQAVAAAETYARDLFPRGRVESEAAVEGQRARSHAAMSGVHGPAVLEEPASRKAARPRHPARDMRRSRAARDARDHERDYGSDDARHGNARMVSMSRGGVGPWQLHASWISTRRSEPRGIRECPGVVPIAPPGNGRTRSRLVASTLHVPW